MDRLGSAVSIGLQCSADGGAVDSSSGTFRRRGAVFGAAHVLVVVDGGVGRHEPARETPKRGQPRGTGRQNVVVLDAPEELDARQRTVEGVVQLLQGQQTGRRLAHRHGFGEGQTGATGRVVLDPAVREGLEKTAFRADQTVSSEGRQVPGLWLQDQAQPRLHRPIRRQRRQLVRLFVDGKVSFMRHDLHPTGHGPDSDVLRSIHHPLLRPVLSALLPSTVRPGGVSSTQSLSQVVWRPTSKLLSAENVLSIA